MLNRTKLISAISAAALFVILEVFSFILITNSSVIQRFRIMGAIRQTQLHIWESNRQLRNYFHYKDLNEYLQNENLALKEQIELYRTYLGDKDSVISNISPAYTYIYANVVKNTSNKQHNYILLDRGSEDGVKPGMGVVTWQGVIGVVNAVNDNFSYVISFLNTNQNISAKLKNSGVFGPMTWTGKSPFKTILKDIPVHSRVNVGDTIVSSGYSTIYPAEIPIGTVSAMNLIQGTSIDLEVTLFENFRALQNVYVVSNNRESEIKELENE